LGAGQAATAAKMPMFFLVSAAFHLALILAAIQMHHGSGARTGATRETVIEVALVGFSDSAQTATTPQSAGEKGPGHPPQRASLSMPPGAGRLAAPKGPVEAKMKNRAARVASPVKAPGSEADKRRIADSDPDLPAQASTRSAGSCPDAVSLSRTASNQGTEIPPDSHGQSPGKNGAPGADAGRPKISAAFEGTGNEKGQGGYLLENFLYIKNRITRHLSYPPVARRLRWQGISVVTFYILENGLVENIKIASSSGHKMLDNHVIDTVKRLQPFPKPPVRAKITMPVKYFLSE
jgi:periplasmic protein TonB